MDKYNAKCEANKRYYQRNKEYILAQARENRKLRKEQGICTQCGKRKLASDSTCLCETCRFQNKVRRITNQRLQRLREIKRTRK